MRNLGILVSASLVAFALACGSGGTPTGGHSGGATAGTTPTGGHSGGASGTTPTGGSCGTTSGTGGGNGSASCSLPDCLKYLATDCVETGTCTTQTDLSTDNFNTCYPNGVTESAVLDSSNVTTLTVKKSGSTCFSTVFEGNDVTNGMGASITVKNACGTTVATVRYDDALTYYWVTCTGAQEVATDPSCLAVYPVSTFMGSHCDEGGCTP